MSLRAAEEMKMTRQPVLTRSAHPVLALLLFTFAGCGRDASARGARYYVATRLHAPRHLRRRGQRRALRRIVPRLETRTDRSLSDTVEQLRALL